MPWTDMPAADGAEWADLAWRTQFVAAIRERKFAVGSDDGLAAWADMDMPAAGDHAARWTGDPWSIVRMQDAVESLAPSYLTTTAVTGNAFTDITDLPWYTVASLRSAAGLDASGFTRKYPREIASTADYGETGWRARLTGSGAADYWEHDGASWAAADDQTSPPDTVTDYGHAEVGDYVGPWLFNELRACLDLLLYTAHHVTVLASTSKGDDASWPVDFEPTWAAAKTEYAAWWSGAGAPDTTLGVEPKAWNSGHNWGDDFRARAQRRTTRFQAPMRPAADLTHLTADAAFYLVAQAPTTYGGTQSFSAQGDGVADGTAALIESQTGIDVGQAAIAMTGHFPAGLSDTIPASPWVAEPATDEVVTTGYETRFGFVVLDCSGGFEYVASD